MAAQLAAAAAGDEEARRDAWWHLWGNIHHQGTVYPATAPAVPVLHDLAAWEGYADRGQAIAFLTEIARAARLGPAPGSTAGVYVADDHAAASELAARLRADVAQVTDDLMRRWGEEGPAIRRFLLLLVAAQPEARERYRALVEPDLPDRHRAAWLAYADWSDSQEVSDRLDELESWAHEI